MNDEEEDESSDSTQSETSIGVDAILRFGVVRRRIQLHNAEQLHQVVLSEIGSVSHLPALGLTLDMKYKGWHRFLRSDQSLAEYFAAYPQLFVVDMALDTIQPSPVTNVCHNALSQSSTGTPQHDSSATAMASSSSSSACLEQGAADESGAHNIPPSAALPKDPQHPSMWTLKELFSYLQSHRIPIPPDVTHRRLIAMVKWERFRTLHSTDTQSTSASQASVVPPETSPPPEESLSPTSRPPLEIPPQGSPLLPLSRSERPAESIPRTPSTVSGGSPNSTPPHTASVPSPEREVETAPRCTRANRTHNNGAHKRSAPRASHHHHRQRQRRKHTARLPAQPDITFAAVPSPSELPEPTANDITNESTTSVPLVATTQVTPIAPATALATSVPLSTTATLDTQLPAYEEPPPAYHTIYETSFPVPKRHEQPLPQQTAGAQYDHVMPPSTPATSHQPTPSNSESPSGCYGWPSLGNGWRPPNSGWRPPESGQGSSNGSWRPSISSWEPSCSSWRPPYNGCRSSDNGWGQPYNEQGALRNEWTPTGSEWVPSYNAPYVSEWLAASSSSNQIHVDLQSVMPSPFNSNETPVQSVSSVECVSEQPAANLMEQSVQLRPSIPMVATPLTAPSFVPPSPRVIPNVSNARNRSSSPESSNHEGRESIGPGAAILCDRLSLFPGETEENFGPSTRRTNAQPSHNMTAHLPVSSSLPVPHIAEPSAPFPLGTVLTSRQPLPPQILTAPSPSFNLATTADGRHFMIPGVQHPSHRVQPILPTLTTAVDPSWQRPMELVVMECVLGPVYHKIQQIIGDEGLGKMYHNGWTDGASLRLAACNGSQEFVTLLQCLAIPSVGLQIRFRCALLKLAH